MSGILREELDMGQLLHEAPQWLWDYREQVGAPDLESAVSVSAGWSVFATRDGAAYNTYRVYLHSRITPAVLRPARAAAYEVSRARAGFGARPTQRR
jgi:hypothetical protein